MNYCARKTLIAAVIVSLMGSASANIVERVAAVVTHFAEGFRHHEMAAYDDADDHDEQQDRAARELGARIRAEESRQPDPLSLLESAPASGSPTDPRAAQGRAT